MSTACILLVEDEAHIREGLRHNLLREGYRVECAARGDEGLRMMRTAAADLVVLDVMLPGMDGFDVCAQARRDGVTTPVLFLSARATPAERVRGLELGADDYLPKPFHLAEFLGRVRALLRRSQRPPAAAGAIARLASVQASIDFGLHRLTAAGGREADLSSRQAALLACLWRAEGEVVSREALMEAGWGQDVWPSSRQLDDQIMSCRRLLEPEPDAPRALVTEPGIGYRLLRGVAGAE